jgi:hypothetical protein
MINEPNAATECLYTTVRNISATTLFFGFLPPHGKRLACGEAFSFWGDIQSWVWNNLPNERERRSFEEALAGTNPVLVIVQTPAMHLFDPTLDQTQIISLDNDTLAPADPCWGTYQSSTTETYCD